MGWAATHVFSVGEVLTANNMNLIQNNINAIAATGTLKYVVANSGGNAVETQWQTGWLECNGAAVSRTTYTTLFTYLNSLSPALPFGNGNGSTTFNVPDFQGRMPVAVASTGHTDVSTIGNNCGTALASRRPKHKHTVVQAQYAYQNFVGGSAIALRNDTGAAGNTGPASNATVGPQTGSEPTDTVPYVVSGIWVIKF